LEPDNEIARVAAREFVSEYPMRSHSDYCSWPPGIARRILPGDYQETDSQKLFPACSALSGLLKEIQNSYNPILRRRMTFGADSDTQVLGLMNWELKNLRLGA